MFFDENATTKLGVTLEIQSKKKMLYKTSSGFKATMTVKNDGEILKQ